MIRLQEYVTADQKRKEDQDLALFKVFISSRLVSITRQDLISGNELE